MSRVIIIYWIYTANNCGMLFSWGVSVCPSGTGLGNEHFLRYVFVLDIYCQQLWNVVQLRGLYVCPLGTGLENVHSTVLGVVNVGGSERHILRGGW